MKDLIQSLTLHHEADGWLSEITNFSNHRPLLLLSLALTKGDVIECGSGHGSTPYLRNYCKNHERNFYSYDSSFEWCRETGSTYVTDWQRARIWNACGLCFIDHAPGEDRKEAVRRMKGKAGIIVCHDTELFGAGDYGFEEVFSLFKYAIHINRKGGGAGASAISDTIDLTEFVGEKIGGYTIEH